jgi:hypothetical protein
LRLLRVTGAISAANPSGLGPLLGAMRDLVRLFARHAVALGELLRRLCHGEAAVAVEKRLPEHVLEEAPGLAEA